MACGRRRSIDLLQIVLNQSIRVPLTCPLKIIDLLLLLCHVELDKVYEVLIAARLAHNHTALVHLDEDLLRTKEVEPVAEASDRQCTLHLGQVVADHLVDKVALDRPVVGTRADLSFNAWPDVWRLDTCLLFELLNFELLELYEFLHLFKLILALANAPFEEFSLLVQMPDILFKALIGLFKRVHIELKVHSSLSLLQNFKSTDVDLLHQAQLFFLVKNQLIVHVHQNACAVQQLSVEYALPIEQSPKADELLLCFKLKLHDFALALIVIRGLGACSRLHVHFKLLHITADLFKLAVQGLSLKLLLLQVLDHRGRVDLLEALLDLTQGPSKVLSPSFFDLVHLDL